MDAGKGAVRMSLDKAIKHGKEHRKPYTGAKAIFRSCRNHGSCPFCEGNRRYKMRDKHPQELGEDDMEGQESKLLEADAPVFEIKKGHCRTAALKVKDGYVFLFCMAENAHTPGEKVTEPEELMPLFGIKLWGIEHFKIISDCLLMAARHYAEEEGKDGD
jgi:hypothetical protein